MDLGKEPGTAISLAVSERERGTRIFLVSLHFLSALIHAFFVQGDLANGHGTVTFPEDLESVLGTAGFQVIH